MVLHSILFWLQDFESLKVLDLSLSKRLTHIPDFSRATKLEKICLSRCEYLQNFGSSLCNLHSLQSLTLSGCSYIDQFPELPMNIKFLDLSGTAIEQVPSSIQCLSYLEELYLCNCKRLKSLPTSICNLSFLKWFDLRGCSMLEYFPDILKPMEHLAHLSLSGTGIRELHSSIGNLIRISSLHLDGCENLKVLPDSIYNPHLEVLSFSTCPRLDNLPPLSIVLHSLTRLCLKNCNILEIPDLLFLPSLEELTIEGTKIDRVPATIKDCCKLYELVIVDCKSLRYLPELPSSIEILYVTGCTSLETLSKTLVPITQLSLEEDKELMFYDCWKLDHNVCNNLMTEVQSRILHLATRSKQVLHYLILV